MAEANAGPGSDLPDPQDWVAQYGEVLLRYALARVADRATALDLVQETFLGALKASDGFSGRSSPKTWLVGILKHKIVDHYRRHSRDPAAPGSDPGEELFDDAGRWKTPPASWRTDPSEALDRRQFWDSLQHCLSTLSPRLASAFSLRELEGLDTEELCKVLDTTATNVWVILHRARLGLRRCLEGSGFGSDSEGAA